MKLWCVVFLIVALVVCNAVDGDAVVSKGSNTGVGSLYNDIGNVQPIALDSEQFTLDAIKLSFNSDSKTNAKPKKSKAVKEINNVSYEIDGTVFVITTNPGVVGVNYTFILMPTGTVFNISNTVGTLTNVTTNYFSLSTTSTFSMKGVTFTINVVSGSTTVNAGGTISIREFDDFTLSVNDNITWIVGDQVHSDFSSFPITMKNNDVL